MGSGRAHSHTCKSFEVAIGMAKTSIEVNQNMMQKVGVSLFVCLLMLVTITQVNAQQKKPNVLVIWGDDIGIYNVSA